MDDGYIAKFYIIFIYCLYKFDVRCCTNMATLTRLPGGSLTKRDEDIASDVCRLQTQNSRRLRIDKINYYEI